MFCPDPNKIERSISDSTKTTRPKIENISEDLISKIAETEFENENEENIEISVDKYRDLLQNPIPVNSASYADLENLGLLSPWEIEAILRYRNDYGPLLGSHELLYLPNFPKEKAELIENFLSFSSKLEEKKLKDLLKYGKHDLFLRYGRNFSTAKAYKENRYSGSPNAYAIRYRFQCQDRLQIGFAMEKDPGEKIFPDSWTAFIAFQNTGIVKSWIIGCYTLHFGYGLHLGGGMFGYGGDPETMFRSGQGIKPYASMAETGYFCGSALSLKCGKNTELNLFYSYKPIDATIKEDIITSISHTGYHRSENEIEKKRNGFMDVLGVAIEQRFNSAKIGMVCSYSHLNKVYMPTSSLSSIFSLLSSDVLGGSIYYQSLIRNVHLYGELGWSGVFNKNNTAAWSCALLQGLQWKAHTSFVLGAYFRYYPKSYTGFFINAPGLTSRGNNELGIGLNARWYAARRIRLDAEFDWAQKDWYAYPGIFPHTNYKGSLRLTFTPPQMEMYLYYQYRGNPISTPGYALQTHLLRFNFAYDSPSGLLLRSRIELKNFNRAFLLYQDIGYNFSKINLSIRFRYALFQSESYAERFYAYESDLLYASSFPSYYGKGQRFYLLLRYKPVRFLTIETRYAQTLYDHTNSFGSGDGETQAYLRPELKIQLRFSF